MPSPGKGDDRDKRRLDHRNNPHLAPLGQLLADDFPNRPLAVIRAVDGQQHSHCGALSDRVRGELTAAAMAALRPSRRRPQVLLGRQRECLFAPGTAEIVRLPFVLGSSSGSRHVDVHAAHRIFYDCCVFHCSALSFVTQGPILASISRMQDGLPLPVLKQTPGRGSDRPPYSGST